MIVTRLEAVALQVTALFAFAIVIAFMLRRAPASVRRALWVTTFVLACTLPVAFAAPRRPQPVFQLPASQIVRAVVARAPVNHRAPAAAQASPTRPAGPAPVSPRAPRSFTPGDVVVAVWLIVALAMIGRVVADALRARRLYVRAQRVTMPGFASAHTVRESEMVQTPVTVGCVDQGIVLPASWRSWTESDLRAVFSHEMAHIGGRDNLVQAFARTVCALHWFNPLAWIALRGLRSECERVADDRVLRSGMSPIAYAELLVRFARDIGPLRSPRAALAMSLPGRELERRLRAIVDARVSRRDLGLVARFSIGTSAAVAVMVAALSDVAPGPRRWTLSASSLSSSHAPQLPRVVPATRVNPPARGDAVTPSDTVADPSSERIPLDSDVWVRARAATASLRGPDSLLARALFAALDHVPLGDYDLVRERAAWVLSRIRGNTIVVPISAFLSSRDWREAACAAWALALHPDDRTTAALITLTQHPVWRARAIATAALANAPDRRAFDAVRAVLADDAWQVRAEAVRFFVALGDRESLDLARSMLNDPHIAVRSEARSAAR